MNVTQSPSQYHPQYQGFFLPINKSFTLTNQEDNCNENGTFVDTISPSTSESSLVSPTQQSNHGNDFSSNSNSKGKRWQSLTQ